MTTCKNCLVEKPLNEYYTHKSTKDGKGSWCKKCLIEKTAEERKNPEKKALWSEYQRRSILKHRYGINSADYDRMLEEQKGVCAICKVNTSGGRNTNSKLAVDHNHTTGEVRGLLCSMCNKGIGMFKENTETMQKAIDYLNSYYSSSSSSSSL